MGSVPFLHSTQYTAVIRATVIRVTPGKVLAASGDGVRARVCLVRVSLSGPGSLGNIYLREESDRGSCLLGFAGEKGPACA